MMLCRRILLACLLGLSLALTGSDTRADQVWTVSVNTSQMAGAYTAPFGIDFELVGSNGNTVTLSSFAFGGGSAGSGPFLTGGASGTLGSVVSLSDGVNFFSDFNQQFTPGSTLTFTMDSTLIGPGPGGSPDNFSMVLFSSYDSINGFNPGTGTGGTPIATNDPTGNDTFFNFNINGPGQTPVVGTWGTPTGDITLTVTPQGVVPEPTSAITMFLGAIGVLAATRPRRNGAARSRSQG
jgi:hypothetical protein